MAVRLSTALGLALMCSLVGISEASADPITLASLGRYLASATDYDSRSADSDTTSLRNVGLRTDIAVPIAEQPDLFGGPTYVYQSATTAQLIEGSANPTLNQKRGIGPGHTS